MNHFPGTGVITRKEELCRLFKQLRCVYGNIYNFTPQSFCVPNEYKKFLREYQFDADKGQKVRMSYIFQLSHNAHHHTPVRLFGYRNLQT